VIGTDDRSAPRARVSRASAVTPSVAPSCRSASITTRSVLARSMATMPSGHGCHHVAMVLTLLLLSVRHLTSGHFVSAR
jgi:hypothetical protein